MRVARRTRRKILRLPSKLRAVVRGEPRPHASVGRRIAAARKSAGYTQRELAPRLGVTVRSLQSYEAGDTIPYRHLHRLGELLDRPSRWFIDPTTDAKVEPSLARTDLDHLAELLLEQLRLLQTQVAELRSLRSETTALVGHTRRSL